MTHCTIGESAPFFDIIFHNSSLFLIYRIKTRRQINAAGYMVNTNIMYELSISFYTKKFYAFYVKYDIFIYMSE